MSEKRSLPRPESAFTLVELMVATAILAVILLLVFSITQQTSDAWKSSAAKIESFQGARSAFESMTRRISQATLNTYYDYFDASNQRRTTGTSGNASSFVPAKYGRYSDLHFISGKHLLDGELPAPNPDQITHSIFFQVPTGYSDDSDYKGLDNTLNACGFYISYQADPSRPAFLATLPSAPAVRNRFRLMEFTQPTQQLSVFDSATGNDWFTTPFAGQPPVRQIAENIVALIIRPKRSAVEETSPLTPNYEYDSRQADWSSSKQGVMHNQLPPLVEIVMVAVDEPSFSRLGNSAAAPDLGLNGKFENVAQVDDLEDFQKALLGKKLKYQVFRSEVPIRSAKWSE